VIMADKVGFTPPASRHSGESFAIKLMNLFQSKFTELQVFDSLASLITRFGDRTRGPPSG